MEENESDIVTLIIEDAISTADTEIAFTQAGLLPYLQDHEPRTPWPTLREMIASGNRLVVIAEQGSAPLGWYLNAWDVMQEPPDTNEDMGSTLAIDGGCHHRSTSLSRPWTRSISRSISLPGLSSRARARSA